MDSLVDGLVDGLVDDPVDGLVDGPVSDLRKLEQDIAAFLPWNQQEEQDRQVMLAALRGGSSCLTRDSQVHFTCSIWTVDPSFTRTLMVYHNVYDSWSWIGGHADGCTDLASVALRELQEETGIASASLVPAGRALGGESPLLSLEVLTVDGHEKRGAYVSSHLHLNVTYLAVASDLEPLRVKEDENSGVRWVPFDQVIPLSTEPWIRSRVYGKLLDKMSRFADGSL